MKGTISGKGYETAPFLIEDEEDFVFICSQFQKDPSSYTYSRKYYSLAADLDFSSGSFDTYISNVSLAIILYGNQHVIKGATLANNFFNNTLMYLENLVFYDFKVVDSSKPVEMIVQKNTSSLNGLNYVYLIPHNSVKKFNAITTETGDFSYSRYARSIWFVESDCEVSCEAFRRIGNIPSQAPVVIGNPTFTQNDKGKNLLNRVSNINEPDYGLILAEDFDNFLKQYGINKSIKETPYQKLYSSSSAAITENTLQKITSQKNFNPNEKYVYVTRQKPTQANISTTQIDLSTDINLSNQIITHIKL